MFLYILFINESGTIWEDEGNGVMVARRKKKMNVDDKEKRAADLLRGWYVFLLHTLYACVHGHMAMCMCV